MVPGFSTNAAGVEQRACRAGPEGERRAANNRTKFDEESVLQKAKPAIRLVSLNKWCPDSD
ncbi:hypothetical protein DMH27_24900 [Raoultella planticola]|nr:hypothetical protein [Raoultella planticola]